MPLPLRGLKAGSKRALKALFDGEGVKHLSVRADKKIFTNNFF